MLTFKDKLAYNLVPEWEEHYVNYSDLKHLVKQIQSRTSYDELDSVGSIDTSTLERVRLLQSSSTQIRFDQAFLNECDKVEAWYSLQLRACQDEFRRLQDEYAAACAAARPLLPGGKSTINAATPTGSSSPAASFSRSDDFNVTVEQTKDALVQLYKHLRMLQNFALLNYTALNKVLKKHKRICIAFEREHRVLNFSLHEFAFTHALPVKSCLVDVESFVTESFFHGDRVDALAELDKSKDDHAVNWRHVFMGLKMGGCAVLALWLVWDDVVLVSLNDAVHGAGGPTSIKLQRTKAFPFYRGMAQGLFFLWLWGATLFVWQAARINYRYILDLDPHDTPDFSHVLEDASHLSTVYLINFLLYMQVEHQALPAYVASGYLPLSLLVYVIAFYAMKAWRKKGRATGVLGDVILAPLFPVSYLDTFVANYMTSSSKMNQDMAWSVCYFATGEFLDPTSTSCSTDYAFVRVVVPLISALPFWWRFLQCLRRVHDMKNWFPGVLNAVKYALSLLVMLFGRVHAYYSPLEPNNALQLVWVVLAVVSSIYTWAWDVLMDWGLGRPAFQFLGDGRMYSRTWVYYGAMAADLVLCFSWTLALVPPTDSVPFVGLLTFIQPVSTFLEPIRRSMWSCFAMENEHLRNTLGFRKELFIPLHFDRSRPKVDAKESTTYAYNLVAMGVVVIALSALTIFIGA